MKRLCTLCLALVMALTCLAAVPAQGADLASVQGAVQALTGVNIDIAADIAAL